MRDRRPHDPNAGEPLPPFDPVPRRVRHDGWTPERQRAFIAALADTGSVSRAAAQVNMSTEGAYYLRRQRGAEGFRRAASPPPPSRCRSLPARRRTTRTPR